MGAPTSSLFSEIYLQSIENTNILDILLTHHIVGYFCYVDDILTAYNQKQTNIKDVLTQFNDSMPTMEFTIEEETDNIIHFRDIAITKAHDSLKLDIYRKPTTTNTIIPKHSCHPPEHKSAAIYFLSNRRDSYSLSDEDKEKENTIKQILRNKYDTTDIQRPPKRHTKPPTHNTKWAKFTYISKEIKYITKLYKNTTVKNKYQMSGVYKLTFPDSNKAYIGQTGERSL
jgi:hypothetical protein